MVDIIFLLLVIFLLKEDTKFSSLGT